MSTPYAVITRHHPSPLGKGKKMNDVWVRYQEWEKVKFDIAKTA
jgi:hypothetical protein